MSEVIEVPRETLLALVQTDAALSEILMRAFILRRAMLLEKASATSLSSARRSRNGSIGFLRAAARHSSWTGMAA